MKGLIIIVIAIILVLGFSTLGYVYRSKPETDTKIKKRFYVTKSIETYTGMYNVSVQDGFHTVYFSSTHQFASQKLIDSVVALADSLCARYNRFEK